MPNREKTTKILTFLAQQPTHTAVVSVARGRCRGSSRGRHPRRCRSAVGATNWMACRRTGGGDRDGDERAGEAGDGGDERAGDAGAAASRMACRRPSTWRIWTAGRRRPNASERGAVRERSWSMGSASWSWELGSTLLPGG
jgi:hypothetical protein